MFTDLLNDVILPALFSIAAAVVPILAGFIIDAVRKWAERQKAEWLRTVLSQATEAAERAVMMVKQTFTDHARNLEGKMPADEAKRALNMALDSARRQLGTDGLAMLAKAVGGYEGAERVLGSLVEGAVAKSKAPVASSDEFLAR